VSSSTIASTAVLDHLHHWQQRAGLPLTWPTFTSDAYREQWQAIKLVELQGLTSP
jgi:hypothetical protein